MEDAEIAKKPLNPWKPESDPRRIAILGKLIEETNEQGSAAGRVLIQGIDEVEPVTLKPNRKWLEDEIADVLALQRFTVEEYGLDIDRIQARAEAKITQLTPWLNSLGAPPDVRTRRERIFGTAKVG